MKTQHKTKLVATIGPSTNTYESLLELVQAGVDVCRLNFSHGDRDTQINLVNLIRRINADFDYNLAILGDLQGPKIRARAVQDGGIELEDGTELLISTDKGIGTRDKVFIQYKSFAEDVRPGEIVLVDDGKIVLEVKETNLKDEVKLKIINGGLLTSKKGVNLPNTKISMPCLTEKDLEDLEFALEHEFEWLGLSFVRSATDVMELKQLISKAGKSTKVIAKIEKPEAMEEINHIIRQAIYRIARQDSFCRQSQCRDTSPRR